MSIRKKIGFEASARLQRLIGRELIPNQEMAIVELVKNAYDSGAHTVRIYIQPDRMKEPGVIRISDDGTGMSESEIQQLFMFAGYSTRPDQRGSARRAPTGEKGIGRFAADKLGRTLEVFTTRGSRNGIHLSIDWRKFDVKGRKKFSDITAQYEVANVSPKVRGKHGTVLEIAHLSSKWTEHEIESLEGWLSDLVNPFSKPTDFSIELEVNGSTRRITTIDPVPPTGDLSMDLIVTDDRVRRIIRARGTKPAVVNETNGSSAALEALGGLRARFVHFDQRPTKERTHGLAPGVRVYRDGFRIEPFGSRTADWLGVAEQRAKRAGHAHIVPNRLFGFVEISRTSNPELGDTTSRQALLDTNAAKNMVTVLREGLSSLGEVLRSRKEPQWRENRRKKQVQLEQARLHTLGEVAAGLAHELRQPLQSIRTAADNIRDKLLQLRIDDEDIVSSQEAIDRGIVRIDKNIALVSDLSKGNVGDLEKCDLVNVLRDEVGVFRPRCAPLGITVSLNAPRVQSATINRLALSIVLLNLLTNSRESIGDGGGAIGISLRKISNRHRIDVEDDGAGVPPDVVPHLFTKFATKKTGGMGVGLYFCKIVVEAHRGRIGHEPRKRGAHFWLELPEG